MVCQLDHNQLHNVLQCQPQIDSQSRFVYYRFMTGAGTSTLDIRLRSGTSALAVWHRDISLGKKGAHACVLLVILGGGHSTARATIPGAVPVCGP